MSVGPFLSSSWYRVAGLRPKLREHVSISRHRYRGSSWYIVHDAATGRAHRLSTASYMIVGGMDGTRTVDQLWHEAAFRLGQEAPSQDDLIQLLAQLHSADLLQTEVTPDSVELLERAAKADRARWLGNILNPLAVRLRFWHPDRFLERTLPLVDWLVGWRGGVLWMIVVLPALVLCAQHWQELSENAGDRILAADNILLMGLTFIVLKALHELGHGYAVKAFGGAVHEIGVMFLVFAPMPYVDASAASEFRSKWRRALVGAAGMIVELFIAALALYVWLAVEQGVVRAVAYNVMVVAGISTVLFNGNPLLRYDGYYILSDLLEIPNLAQRATRYWGHLVDSYAFRVEGLPEFVATPGERVWLLLYAPASFLYRIFVIVAIAIFIASEYLAVGVAIAIWGFLTGVALPMGKALWQVFAGPRLQRHRARAASTTCGFILLASIVLFGIPAPLYTTTEGVVWLPETANVRAAGSGFVRRLLVEPGHFVPVGAALVESEEPILKAGLEVLHARVAELETRLAAERFTDRVKAEITATELGHARAELADAADRAQRLVARSRGEGIFAVDKPQDLPGRFLKQGHLIGYVLPSGSRIVRATIAQDDIDLVRNRLRHTFVKLAERIDETLPARIIREVPAGRDDLPSKALGGAGGGALALDPRDPQGTKTIQRVFQVDIELPPDVTSAAAFGSRAHVRFDHHWEPIGQQIWRRARQLVLSRLHA
jgi:putative peptide zinc metalloprotease protein